MLSTIKEENTNSMQQYLWVKAKEGRSCYKKEITHKRLNIRTILHIIALKETYYRANDYCKSTIDLTIALEYKEYKLRGSDNFPIIMEDERKVSTKKH